MGESILEDCFVVFFRPAPRPAELPQSPERPIRVCSTYAEAQRFRRSRRNARNYVIRFVGEVGGGD